MSGNASNHIWVEDSTHERGGYWVRQQGTTSGAAHSNITNGLANKTIALAAAGTYNATEVHGFMVLVAASDAWTLTFTEDGTTRSIPAAALALGQIYPFKLSEITAGTSGEALLFLL